MFTLSVAESGTSGSGAKTHISRGLAGTPSDLTNLDDGDVKMTVDLREIYVATLDDWVSVASPDVLKVSPTKAKIFRA